MRTGRVWFLRVALPLASALGIAFLSVAPANADLTAGTDVTFTVGAGALAITAPATANLGSANPGGTTNVQLGDVTASDTRGGATSDWTVTVTSDANFVDTTPDPDLTIANSNVFYSSGTASATTGGPTFTPGQTTTPGDALSTSPDAYAHAGGTGGSTAVWQPTITVQVPITAQSGTYTGTVTHTIA